MFHQTAKNIYDLKMPRLLAEETKGAGTALRTGRLRSSGWIFLSKTNKNPPKKVLKK